MFFFINMLAPSTLVNVSISPINLSVRDTSLQNLTIVHE